MANILGIAILIVVWRFIWRLAGKVLRTVVSLVLLFVAVNFLMSLVGMAPIIPGLHL